MQFQPVNQYNNNAFQQQINQIPNPIVQQQQIPGLGQSVNRNISDQKNQQMNNMMNSPPQQYFQMNNNYNYSQPSLFGFGQPPNPIQQNYFQPTYQQPNNYIP
jgi:hypothetical protein